MDIPEHNLDAPLEPQLTDVLTAYMRQTMTAEFLIGSRVLQSEFMRNPEAAQRFKAAYLKVDAPLTRLVSDAMTAGQLSEDDPNAATTRLLAMFKSMILLSAILNSVGARVRGHRQHRPGKRAAVPVEIHKPAGLSQGLRTFSQSASVSHLALLLTNGNSARKTRMAAKGRFQFGAMV